jgi:hypothetical protein
LATGPDPEKVRWITSALMQTKKIDPITPPRTAG